MELGGQIMYEISVDKVKKTFTINVGGFFDETEGKKFVDEYAQKTNQVNPYEYSLIICGENLAVSKPEMLPVLKSVFEMYKGSNFNKSFGTLPESTISAMQLQRVARETNFDITFVKTIEEALNKL